ncbi:hypothetical protein CU048_09820 [Beijerinckiaceae bacterium]|nr:hypothetical protein CU048_09820 [Beijerinckiaceae bacterium]
MLEVQAADVERWTCTDKIASTTWTIVDGRMFAAKGKGYFTVLSDSPTLVVAYYLYKTSDNKTVSLVNILDKTAKKMIKYDDSTAVIFHGTSYQPYEAEATVATCVRE